MATGKATKLIDYFHNLPKTYIAEVLFGQISDTYDLEGKIDINKDVKEFNRVELEKYLKKFLGKQNQQAPIFSAKKIKGKKLHVLAREGKKVDPPFKEVEIYSLKITSFNYPKLELKVSSSAGTYIRSLANDLGRELKTGALLSNLKRVSIGDFNLDNAINLDNLSLDILEKNRLDVGKVIKTLGLKYPQQHS